MKDVFEFEWDDANIGHVARHHVSSKECEDVYFDTKKKSYADSGHSKLEKRFILIGKTSLKKLLYVVFTKRDKKIRVVTARRLNRREVYLYEEEA